MKYDKFKHYILFQYLNEKDDFIQISINLGQK